MYTIQPSDSVVGIHSMASGVRAFEELRRPHTLEGSIVFLLRTRMLKRVSVSAMETAPSASARGSTASYSALDAAKPRYPSLLTLNALALHAAGPVAFTQ